MAAGRAVHAAREPRGRRRVTKHTAGIVAWLTCPRATLADALRAYLKQAREETGARLVLKCYTEDDKPNKFWMAFSKRKFMNKEL